MARRKSLTKHHKCKTRKHDTKRRKTTKKHDSKKKHELKVVVHHKY